jgi:GDP-L-fucose synthase
VNVGTGSEISIKDLAEEIAKATGFTGRFVWNTSQPNGQPRRRLDVTKAKERFGFEAKVGLAEGLRRTVDWAVQERAAGRL